MIPLQIEITSYDIESNDCQARLLSGNFITLDPFVGCALPLDDVSYAAGKGADIVGNKYVLTRYSVYPNNVVPHQGGMILI